MIVMSSPLESNAWQPLSNHFFLEQAEEYVNALKKSTSRVLILRGDFEHCMESSEQAERG
jgi:hypothetical protein